ncbi:MAG: universal stress protein [Hyphomicrobium sp.]|uniref:universal stress protein n=1 Tax=Hyphomicrobium sp. TaxID=82 RepID=UPI001323CF1C|nr:universal stress protein [Hyphomicrobium sp.]KAB2943535.1 MAG: universal stress protein [Hyphomicrobium sp.]MBZ0209753.1 universal stress protein [Hyphomicrobium sp.]
MYSRILIATDGTELSDRAVEQGLALAAKLGADVTAINVTEPHSSAVTGEWALAFPIKEYDAVAEASAGRILGKVAEMARELGVSCKTVHVTHHFAAEAIVDQANDHKCDLIVMASHGRRGVARFFLGSQALHVLTSSTIPVLICK